VVHLTIDAATALGLAQEPAEVTTDLHGPRLAPPELVDAATGRRSWCRRCAGLCPSRAPSSCTGC
jgi:hypothetical protein